MLNSYTGNFRLKALKALEALVRQPKVIQVLPKKASLEKHAIIGGIIDKSIHNTLTNQNFRLSALNYALAPQDMKAPMGEAMVNQIRLPGFKNVGQVRGILGADNFQNPYENLEKAKLKKQKYI